MEEKAIAALQQENADLKKLVAGLEKQLAEAGGTKPSKADPRIAKKMAAGLTYQQAVEVLASQDEADKQAKSRKEAAE
jgi:cell division septum initiation protein DivIVA